MMSRRRHHRHNKPPPTNRITTNRLHHAVEEEPMMIHGHRDDDGGRTMRPVVLLQPNVIARLMGMDDAAVPTSLSAKPAAGTVHVQFQAQRRQTNNFTLRQLPEYSSYRGGNSDDNAEYSSPSSRLCLNTMMVVPRSRSSSSRLRQRRRHPQEEELLQNMRQDLEAWQVSKAPALQTSRPSESDGGRSLVLQAIAQEDLRRQKMARYGFGLGLGHSKVTQLPLIKKKKQNGSVEQGEGDPSSEHDYEHAAAAMPDESVVVVTAPSHYHRPAETAASAAAPAAEAQELPSHGHTPIVLLKPATTCSAEIAGGVAIGGGQKTSAFLGLPKLHMDANMSMLLQEVKNRVHRELALAAAAATVRGEPIKTPASARGIPPLQRQATKEDRGNKRRLFRSESFRAFRRDRKRNASPEAYILKNQTVASPKKADDEESVADPSLSVLRPGVVGVPDGQSFRSECLTTKHKNDDASASSPRLLFRSLSAPESGFSFTIGRLFSFKQHQTSEPAAAEVRMTSKNVVSAGFSSFILGTVSSLRRHGLTSRRNLMMFRRKRKTHWPSNNSKMAIGAGEIHPAKMEVPSAQRHLHLMKLSTCSRLHRQANLSELPPSPVSPLEVAAGHSSGHFFTHLHFTLPPELSPKCLSQLEAPATTSESSFRTDITAVETAWSRDKAYITELLIAAGLYDDDDGPSVSANARVDSMARPMPICDDVFEDVEDMYYYRGDYIVSGGMFDGTDHRMLFDLANEALQRLVAESSRGGNSSLCQWVVDSTGVARGKKLVDDVWRQVQALRNHPQAQEMQTIEGMVAYQVRRSVWAEVLYEDVCVVGRKIERAIFDELIEDLVACAGRFHIQMYDYTCRNL